MEKPRRRSVAPVYSMCVQPSFIIGTNNEDGSANFAPITWVSVTHEEGDGYLLVISMFGTKKTKQNVLRTGMFSANLVSTDMLPLMDYFGSRHAKDGKKDGIDYQVSRGEVLDVPVLDQSRWVYECEVSKAVTTGDSATFFCPIRNIQIDERLVICIGDDDARMALALLYEHGAGVPQSYEEADRLYEQERVRHKPRVTDWAPHRQ